MKTKPKTKKAVRRKVKAWAILKKGEHMIAGFDDDIESCRLVYLRNPKNFTPLERTARKETVIPIVLTYKVSLPPLTKKRC